MIEGPRPRSHGSRDGPRIASADEAAQLIRSGYRVVVGSAAGTPRPILSAISNRQSELEGVVVFAGLLGDVTDALPPDGHHVRMVTWMGNQGLATSKLASPSIDVLPVSWFRAVTAVARDQIDVAIVQVSPADRAGFHSLGVSVSYTLPLLRRARIVIAEVNEQMPRTLGQALVHESEFDVIVHTDRPLPQFPDKEPNEQDRQIAETASTLIDPGSTVQFGVGSLPAALAARLARRGAPFWVHSFLGDAAGRLIESGIAKPSGRPSIIGEIAGTDWLYRFVHENSAISMAGSEGIHSQSSLADVAPLISANAALEVDLFGQVNSEFLNGHRVSGIGGGLDFMISTYDEENLSILLLRSKAAGVSRIVPVLAGPVSVSRALTQVVITEYGVADLRRRTVDERARLLIEIADPEYRPALTRAWEAFT